jgi:hypothetical protein
LNRQGLEGQKANSNLRVPQRLSDFYWLLLIIKDEVVALEQLMIIDEDLEAEQI